MSLDPVTATGLAANLATVAGAVGTAMYGLWRAVDRRFEQVERRFEQVDRRFEEVGGRFDRMEQRFDRRFQALEGRMDRRFTGVETRLDRIEVKMDQMGQTVRALGDAEHRRDPTFGDRTDRLRGGGGNPYDPERKDALIDRWKEGTITIEEGEELSGYLEEDLRAAETVDDWRFLVQALGRLNHLLLLKEDGVEPPRESDDA